MLVHKTNKVRSFFKRKKLNCHFIWLKEVDWFFCILKEENVKKNKEVERTFWIKEIIHLMGSFFWFECVGGGT